MTPGGPDGSCQGWTIGDSPHEAPLRAQRQKAALKEREDLSRQIFQHSHDAIFILDPFEDRLLYVNPSACAMLEYEREELLGTPVSAIHPNEMPRFKEFAQEIFKNGGGWTDQLTYTTKSGRHIPAEISGSVVVRDGQRRMLAIVRDISVRRQREDPRLESVRRQHELILDAVGDGLLGIAMDGRITFINPAGAEILGGTVEDFVGEPCTKVTLPRLRSGEVQPFELCPLIETLHASSSHRGIQAFLHHIRGSTIPVEFTSTPVLEDGTQIGCVFSFTDVSQKTRVEEELRRGQKLEAVGLLAGGIAHDFNNLLTAIIGHAELLAEPLPDEDPVRADLASIIECGERGAALTRKLLEFSRSQPLEPRLIDLNTIIRGVEGFLMRLLGEDVRLETDLTDEPTRFLGDPTQIEQVVMNLAINARDAMPHGGRLTMATDIVVAHADEPVVRAGLDPGTYASLEVSDTGIGIDPENLQRIFEPFFTTKDHLKSTGLGLSTVYGIVKQSGGGVWVSSELGEGSTFTVYFPITNGEATPNP